MPPPLDFIGRVTHNPLISFTAEGRKLSQLLQRAQDWNYVPVGSMLFITSDFKVIPNEDPTAQKFDVAVEFVEDLVHKDFSSFAGGAPLAPARQRV